MTQQQLEIIISFLGACHYSKRGLELNFCCPFPNCTDDGQQKLAVHKEQGKWHCWRCGQSGRKLDYLVTRFGSLQDRQHWFGAFKHTDLSLLDDFVSGHKKEKEKKQGSIFLPKEFTTLVGNNSLTSLRARNYLKNRGVTKEQICMAKVGFCLTGEYANRIVLPSFNSRGELNFFTSRTFANEKYKYKTPDIPTNEIIFNELGVDFSKPVTLVEGVFDAFTSGGNTVPILGSSLTGKSALIAKLARETPFVYLALDPDTKGGKEKKVVDILRRNGVRLKLVPVAPFSDLGEMPREEFLERKENSVFLTQEVSIMALLSEV